MTTDLHDDEEQRAFAADVRRGLGSSGSEKVLSPKYFYDALGSQLFEAICQLPWYPITRAENRLLERDARAMVTALPGVHELVELGCGSGEKLARLAVPLAALATRAPLQVHLIDVSEKALELSRGALARIVPEPGRLRVTTHRASYDAGLASLASLAGAGSDAAGGARLVCFLGSNIGNFDPPEAVALLTSIRDGLRPGDGLLLGTDLVRSEAQMCLAYADPLGVTAAFNKNILLRINRELGGDFDLDAFTHQARWNAAASRIEMRLVSRRTQVVRIPGADVVASFAEGESIWTESSYKYSLAGVSRLAARAGLAVLQSFVDEEGSFATSLLTSAIGLTARGEGR